MLREYDKSDIRPLPVLLALVTLFTGCATPGQISTPSVDEYVPLAMGQHVRTSPASMDGTLDPDLAASSGGLSKDALSLSECLEIALNQNPAQFAARHGVTVATETVGIAKALYYPEVNFMSSWNRSLRSSTLPGGVTQLVTPDSNGPTNDWLAGFAARYTIADGGRRAAELRRALALNGATEGDVKRIRQDIVFEVQSSFYRPAAATQVHNVAEENLSRAKAHLDLVQRLYSANILVIHGHQMDVISLV
ncbi:MAG: TolC family protein [Candidatus Hydrogenedentes bacterium]|nr:TolC family protein [Candidatus Hydrogenedentota bacterium]